MFKYELHLKTDAPSIPNDRPVYQFDAENNTEAVEISRQKIKETTNKILSIELWKIAELVADKIT